jgi:hypothetical protein
MIKMNIVKVVWKHLDLPKVENLLRILINYAIIAYEEKT